MNRKKFLSSVVPLGATIAAFAGTKTEKNNIENSKTPPYLKKGDIIGITCPAGYITAPEIQSAVAKMQEWGLQVKVGSTVGKRDFTYGGTDKERLDDMQQMLDDSSIKAIMCARGGYGAVRIIDELSFKKFNRNPKWLIGFSDVTVLHSHINRNYGIATIHSKMCNSFPDDWSKAEQVQIDSIESIRQCLFGEKMKYAFLPNAKNRTGFADGELVGGNLKTLESLSASKSDIDTTDKILFVEDTGEYLYSIDRMFWNLKRTGKLAGLKGLIVGGFKVKKDEGDDDFGKALEDIVLEKISGYSYPVCFDFPVGHQKNNMALKCGTRHRLSVFLNECSLSELR